MNTSLKALLLAATLLSAPLAGAAAPAPLAPAAVLADPARSAEDRARDADRKAAEVLSFTGIKPGDKVADVFPGGGYFTRIFAKAAAPGGKVYGVVRDVPKTDVLTTNPAFPNIALAVGPWEAFAPAEKLDVIFISQFEHDLYNPKYGAAPGGAEGIDKVNRAMFNALKPGGVIVIVDHAGRPGTGASEMDTLHRIEEPTLIAALTRVGFKLVAESQVLRNPADPRTANVFDPSIRGKTDQFMLKFRKPS